MGLEGVCQREANDPKRLTGRNLDPDQDLIFGSDQDSDLDLDSYLDITQA